MTPANSRRPRMPMILKRATATMAGGGRAPAPAPRRRPALAERREDDALGHAADDVGAGDRHPAVEAAAQQGEGEHPPLLADGAPDVAQSSPHDGVSAAGHSCPPGWSGRCPTLYVIV